jgi:uncharacterized protein (DUF1330 family)
MGNQNISRNARQTSANASSECDIVPVEDQNVRQRTVTPNKWEETVKIHYAVPLAVVIGLGFGAVAIRGLHARTTTPPVYVVVEIDEIIDANGFEALRQTADATAVEVQSEDGRYFARTENVTALDGSAPKFFAFIAFDNMTKAKTFNDSMKNTTALRTRVTKSRSFIVEGTIR